MDYINYYENEPYINMLIRCKDNDVKYGFRKKKLATINEAKNAFANIDKYDEISLKTRAEQSLLNGANEKLELALRYYENKKTPEELLEYAAKTLVISRLIDENTPINAVENIYNKIGKKVDENFYDEFKMYKKYGENRMSYAIKHNCNNLLSQKLLIKTEPISAVYMDFDFNDEVDREAFKIIKSYVEAVQTTPDVIKSKNYFKAENFVRRYLVTYFLEELKKERIVTKNG